MDENIVFELQISKPLLDQILDENQLLKQKYDEYQDKAKQSDQKTNLRAVIHLVKEGQNVSEETSQFSKELKLQVSESQLAKTATSPQSEEKLKENEENISAVKRELRATKELLRVVQEENRHLDIENLSLERQVESLSLTLRLEEEKNKSDDLANVECKLLKLKLRSIENEKNYLLQEFEKERKIMTKQSKPRVAKLEENIKHLRKWIEKEAKERRPHDTAEVKALKEQIHVLEHDKSNLIEGFELERKVFQKILKSSTTHLDTERC